MRPYRLLPLILIILAGCSIPHLTKNGRDTVDLGNGGVAYVVSYEELKPLLARQGVTYEGTRMGYHILMWWLKLVPSDDWVLLYAVPADQWSPKQPFEFGNPPVMHEQHRESVSQERVDLSRTMLAWMR